MSNLLTTAVAAIVLFLGGFLIGAGLILWIAKKILLGLEKEAISQDLFLRSAMNGMRNKPELFILFAKLLIKYNSVNENKQAWFYDRSVSTYVVTGSKEEIIQVLESCE